MWFSVPIDSPLDVPRARASTSASWSMQRADYAFVLGIEYIVVRFGVGVASHGRSCETMDWRMW